MSLLSSIGTKIGDICKSKENELLPIETSIADIRPIGINAHYIGYRTDYFRAVVPLCEIKLNTISYTSGRLDFIRKNGCCSQLPLHIDIKVENDGDGINIQSFTIHNNLPANMRLCKFTKNGITYGGLEVFYNVQAHNVYFIGVSTLEPLFSSRNAYWKYKDVRDNSISDTEINNSLVIL